MSLTPVLIVSYFFPPAGGAGTQRPAKFAKWLPSFGYEPIVVAADARLRPATAPMGDGSLEEEVKGTRVLRVPADAPAHLPACRRGLLWAKFREDQEEWVAQARPVVERAIREYQPGAMVVTVSPYAAAELGVTLGRRHGLPWALDLRDPWVLDGWYVPTTRVHAIWHRRVMIRALRAADLVIANTPAARKAYIALAGLAPGKAWTIPNGYDSEDFASVGVGRSKRDEFRLVHVGTLHSVESPRRGRLQRILQGRREIDETGRSGRYLFEAIALLRARHPELFMRLKVELVGQVHPSHVRLAENLGIGSALEYSGYLPHRESLARIMAADAVFVPLHRVHGGPALIVPGKLYEAIASGRFVLGALPEGDGARLIRESGAGEVVGPEDVEGMAGVLGRLMAGMCRPAGAPAGAIAGFTRQRLAARLARGLDVMRGIGAPQVERDPWEEVVSRSPAALQVV